MRGILCFSSTFTLTLSHDGDGSGDSGANAIVVVGSFAVGTRHERFVVAAQVHSLEETVLISCRTFTTFLSFYHGRTRPNGFSRAELQRVLARKHMFPY